MKETKRVNVPNSQQLDLFSKQRRSRSAEAHVGSSKRDRRGTRRSAVVDARSYEWMPYIDIDHVPGHERTS